jgi:hypothetical protein
MKWDKQHANVQTNSADDMQPQSKLVSPLMSDLDAGESLVPVSWR